MVVPTIQFVNRVFPPVHGATGRLVADLGRWFAAEGWQVEILTCAAAAGEDRHDGMRVVRVAVPEGRGLGAAGRQLAALAWAAARRPCPDVTVTLTDPPLLALLGPLQRRRGAAAIHWCHDLYPDLLPVIGSGVPHAALAPMRSLMRRAMAAHDAVVAIGECMAARLVEGGVVSQRQRRGEGGGGGTSIMVVPNWPDPAIRPDPAAAASFRAAHGLTDRFVVTYSGNFGRAHPLGAVLEAAARLRSRRPGLVFVMIGSGARYAETAAEARRLGLANMRFLPFQPPECLSASLGAADLHLAVQAQGTAGLMVPCKVAGVLAAGRPCLLLGPAEGDAARRLAESGAGLVMPPDDGAGLAVALERLAGRPEALAAMAARAPAAVAPLRLQRAVPAFVTLARGLVARRSRRPAGTPAPLAGAGPRAARGG